MEQTKINKKSFAYKMGTFIGTILLLCATTVVVALTFKFLMWLF